MTSLSLTSCSFTARSCPFHCSRSCLTINNYKEASKPHQYQIPARSAKRSLYSCLHYFRPSPGSPALRKGVCVMASSTAETASELPATWSNPSGSVLTPIAENVWAAERPFIWSKIDVGGRMAVLRLSDGTIWVHSPVALEPALKEALDKLGPVRHVVSPNYEHLKFAPQWLDAYPEAKSYACPGLRERDERFAGAVTVGTSEPPTEWLGEVDCEWLSYEHNPFTSTPFFNEVVFLHKPSKILIASDLVWNYPSEVPLGTRIWKFGMDQVYLPFYRAFMIKDPGSYKQSVKKLLKTWDWDGILPCHGKFIPSGGKAFLANHLGEKL